MIPMVRYAALAAILFLSAPASGALSQERPVPAPRPDSVRPDTLRPDTIPGDSVAADRPPPDPAADSIAGLLRELEGFVATEYQGKSAVYRAEEGVLRLEGSAEVEREGNRLNADTIVYRNRTQFVEAYGSPTVSGQSQELQGNVLYYDLARRRATALEARTKVSEGANWFVRGDVTLEGTERIYATHGNFTTCDLEIPHYHFEADKIMVVRDKLLVARPARLYFGKVPVMVLPFVVQNLERGRRSGLLVPRFSINDIVRTSSGYTREISDLGWYWAINQYLGAQVTGSWRSEAFTSLQGNVDWNWRRQFLNGSATFQRYWETNGDKQFHLNARSGWKPDERTDLALDARYATSSRFIRDVSFDPREVTQDLTSSARLNRRFDWGTLALGADRRQSVSDGSVTGTLPSFTVSPKTITFLRALTEEQERWYSNTSLQLALNGTRTFTQGKVDFDTRVQDATNTRLQGGVQSLTVGNLNLSATGSFNQALLEAATGFATIDEAPREVSLEGRDSVAAQWQANIGYQQQLIGQTIVTPTVSLSQDYRSYRIPDDRPLAGFAPEGTADGPLRMNVGASLGTALFGFFPGFGPYTAIRHRLSPQLNYYYSPAVELDSLQARVFGSVGGLAQNRVSLGFNQTFEAKLREPSLPEEGALPAATDSLATDSLAADSLAPDSLPAERGSVPTEPQKVTILSITTSPVQYDFTLADSTGNGFVTDRISNSISSDYLRGLTVQIEHELFDRTDLDPNDVENQGELGTFSPRLSSLSTGFELGPNTALVRWLASRLGPGGEEEENLPTQGVFPGTPPDDDPTEPGTGAFTGNPQDFGGGPWRASLQYSFSRPTRSFRVEGVQFDDRAVQTVSANTSFALTPNWAVSWTTDYSITDSEFGSHRLGFRRDLHRWQANFNFYKTPNGNAAFQFFVELIDNRDLKFDYSERNLGIDKR